MTRLLFFTSDLIVYLLIIAIVLILRHGQFNWLFFYYNCQILIPLFLLITIILDIFSFYDLKLLKKSRTDYKNIIIAFFIALFASSAFIYFIKPILNIATPKTTLIGIFILYFYYTYLSRKFYTKISFSKTNVLIFGKSRTLNEIKKEIANSTNYNILGEYETAKDIDYPQKVDEIIIASKLFKQDSSSWDIIAQKLLMKGYLLTTDLIMFEKVFKRISKEGIKDTMWLLRGIAQRQESHIFRIIKRLTDFIFAFVLLIPLFFFVIIPVYILIKIIDGFDPIFKQERVGQHEKQIFIYKFRTMKPGTENITKLGSILRRFRLDEVPQLINILKGNISFVGPRPLAKEDNSVLNKFVPSHAIRSIVKPGLTGWAQLNFKAPLNYSVTNLSQNNLDDEVFDAAFKRLAYDVWYIKNQNLFLDLEIILQTAKRAFIKDSHVS